MPTTIAVFQERHPWRDFIDEKTVYHKYTHERPAKQSKYIKGETQSARNYQFFVCPVCGTSQADLRHGELRQCDCGMLYELYGNRLGLGRVPQVFLIESKDTK